MESTTEQHKLLKSLKNCPEPHSQFPDAQVDSSQFGFPCCPECGIWDIRFYQRSQSTESRLVLDPKIEKNRVIRVICIPCNFSFIFDIDTKKNVVFIDEGIFIANEKMLEEEIGYKRS